MKKEVIQFLVRKNIPFYDQITLADWKRKGFSNEKDAVFWHRKACGISCAQMVGEAFTGEKTQLGKLIVEGVEGGAYLDGKGWIHGKLAEFISKRFGLSTSPYRDVSSAFIKKLLNKRKLIIASVGVGFRGMKSGHLVLIIGFGIKQSKLAGFYVHHPSTNPAMCMREEFIPIEVFENSFSGNIVEIYKKTE